MIAKVRTGTAPPDVELDAIWVDGPDPTICLSGARERLARRESLGISTSEQLMRGARRARGIAARFTVRDLLAPYVVPFASGFRVSRTPYGGGTRRYAG